MAELNRRTPSAQVGTYIEGHTINPGRAGSNLVMQHVSYTFRKGRGGEQLPSTTLELTTICLIHDCALDSEIRS